MVPQSGTHREDRDRPGHACVATDTAESANRSRVGQPTRPGSTPGRNFEAMDPLAWLARLADHIPDPGKHRTHSYAHYAYRVPGQRWW